MIMVGCGGDRGKYNEAIQLDRGERLLGRPAEQKSTKNIRSVVGCVSNWKVELR